MVDFERGSGSVYNFYRSKMDPLGEIEYLSDTPVIKFRFLENLNKRIWIHKYLASRSENGEFERSYEELRQHDQKFFEYTRMTPSTFDSILKSVEMKLRKHSNFRESISPEHKLIVNYAWLNVLLHKFRT